MHAKDRERKRKPCLFSVMVLEMRLYFWATETNVAKNILPYFPQQTMTLSEIDLTNRLLLLTKEQEGDNPVPLIHINLDFIKWNVQWRFKYAHFHLR